MLKETLDQILKFIRETEPGKSRLFTVNGEYNYEEFETVILRQFGYPMDGVEKRRLFEMSKKIVMEFLVNDVHNVYVEVTYILRDDMTVVNPVFYVEVLE